MQPVIQFSPCGYFKGSRKVPVKAAYVIVNFVMNSTGPPHTHDSISALRIAMRCATPSVYLDLREPRVEISHEDCSYLRNITVEKRYGKHS